MKNSLSIKPYVILTFIVSAFFIYGYGDQDDHKGHDHSKHEDHDHKGHGHSEQKTCDHDHHDHGHSKVKKMHDPLVVGPRGGKVLSHPGHRVELWVGPQRRVHISSLDEKGSKAPLADFSVSAMYGKRSAPSQMSFSKVENEWVSKRSLPEGKSVQLILTTTIKDKTLYDRIDLKLWNCSGCDLQEYACTCSH
jgi:hypothetical protein